MTARRRKTTRRPSEDVPFTALLPNGRTLFVLVPAKWCELDFNGEVLFKPDAIRMLDRVQAMATRIPRAPTRGYIKTLRDALGLTQVELGKRLKVDSMTISRWERGTVKPSGKAVAALEKLRRDSGRRGTVIAA